MANAVAVRYLAFVALAGDTSACVRAEFARVAQQIVHRVQDKPANANAWS